MSFPKIETARLQLKPFVTADIDPLYDLWTEPSVRKYLWDDLIISRSTAVEVVQSSLDNFAESGFGYWAICLKQAPELIGFCGLRYFQEDGVDGKEVEILYGLDPKYWGRGLATEAAKAILRFGFEQIGLKQILAGADPPNQDSFRVIQRIGMSFSHRAKVGGLDAIYYVLHRQDLQVDDMVFRVITK